MAIDHDDVFYLGDNPVVLQHAKTPSSGRELGFDISGVEAFLPLAPKCALYVPCVSTSEQIIAGYRTTSENICSEELSKLATPADVPALLQLSKKVVQESHVLYQSLTTGVFVVASVENVEKLNYLQCTWASAAIYSSRRDFSFARRVYRDNPQYRHPVSVRLAPSWEV